MNAQDVINATIPELTAIPRPELEELYAFWRKALKESAVGSDERKQADTQMQRLLCAMRRQVP